MHSPGAPSAARAGAAPFALLWAFALLYHQARYGAAVVSPVDAALTIATLALIVRPDWPRLLGLTAALHVAAMLRALPNVYNHWYFGALVSSGIVIAWIVAFAVRRQAGPPGERASLFETFAPAGRTSAIALYAMSGFHKLNADFFTPGVSCASVLTDRATSFLRIGALVPEPGTSVIWLTVLVELGLPVLLLIPRLRTAGVVVGIGFHLVMAVAGYPRFSATGVALLSLFLPADAFRPGAIARLLASLPPSALAVRFVFVLLLLSVIFVGPPWMERVFLASQIALSLWVLEAAVQAWRASMALPSLFPPRPRHPLTWTVQVATALVFAAGVQPYLGLPTDRALAMYSNLRTEGGMTNHFVIPASVQVFPFQRDLAELISSSAPSLQQLADDRMALPWAELRARLAVELRSAPDVAIRYRMGGNEFDVPSVRSDSVLSRTVSRLHLMIFRFRPVETSGPRACTV